MLWRGLKDSKAELKRPARGFADNPAGPDESWASFIGGGGKGNTWPGQTNAGPTGLRQTVCKREKGEAFRKPLNPEQS